MKNRFVVLLGLVLLVACKSRGDRQLVISQKDSTPVLNKAMIDTGAAAQVINEKHEEKVDELDGMLKMISATEYNSLGSLNKPGCDLDSNGFIKNLGVTLKKRCDEVCETQLVETKSGKTMSLPTDFDTGILGVLVSPLCDRFVTYSSYDMPDYNKYYAHRALIILYGINKGVGLKAISQKKTLGLKAWSIMEVKWLDEKSISLKLYKEAYSDKVKFAYFKVEME
jgi:hypothetical protein